MACVDDDQAAPPDELRLAWLCAKWGAMPEGGGMYDQPYRTMRRMSALDNVYSLVQHYRSLQGAQIHTLSVSQRKLLRSLIDMGVM